MGNLCNICCKTKEITNQRQKPTYKGKEEKKYTSAGEVIERRIKSGK